MARLIDADKLESSLNETVDAAIKWHEDCLGDIMQNRSEAAITAFVECILKLKEQPTVDAVEVVRCKDCKYCFVDGDDDWKYNVCYFNRNMVHDDWFCADGERRENDGSD